MSSKYRRNSNYLIGGAIAVVVAQALYSAMVAHARSTDPGNGSDFTSLVLQALSAGLFFAGVYNYAKGKGYSAWYSLLGFLSLIGLLILVLLPDKRKGEAPRTS